MYRLEWARAQAGYAWLWATLRLPPLAEPIGEAHSAEMQCEEIHCYSHHRDEPGRYWLRCFECGHHYATPGELRRAYRREAWSVWQSTRKLAREPVGGHGGLPSFTLSADGGELVAGPPLKIEWSKPPGRLRVLWRLATIRASKIYFCQECIHDF